MKFLPISIPAPDHPIMRRMVCGKSGQQLEERYRVFLMGYGGDVRAERMLKLGWSNAELGGGKWKNPKQFSGPNLLT